MKQTIIIFLILSCSTFLYSEDYFLQGTIRHANTLEVISDVNIYIKDLPVGTTSDEAGEFQLQIKNVSENQIVVFNHVAFDTLQMFLKNAINKEEFFLKPNLLQTNKIIVEAQKAKSEFAKDLPQSLTIIDAKEFEGKGYIDVADLLRTDQSVQVEEDLSGKKTISMRGGNPEDVIVFYNGIKMNNNYDNVFDLTLINIEDIQQIEVIKGSNTALFGSEAFSGVINIIPKTKQDYSVRFIQKFGTYDSGDWNLQLNHSFADRLHFSYNQKRAGTKRPFKNNKEFLQNHSLNHSANITYDLAENNNSKKSISLMYMWSHLDYKNTQLFETIDDLNEIASVRYTGNIAFIDNLNITGGYQNLDNKQYITITDGIFDKHFLNDNYYFNIEKSFLFEKYSILAAYQHEDGKLDYKEQRTSLDPDPRGLQSATLTRQKNGAVGIVKLETPTGSEFLETADINFSYRFDDVRNKQKEVVERNEYDELTLIPGLYNRNNWSESTIKFSTQLKGSGKDITYGVFISTGNNVKFPTMFHQLSSPSELNPNQPGVIPNLNPEKNKSTEIGIDIIKETPNINTINGWQINLNYFDNLYENKFRSYRTFESSIAFYDNVQDASISGFETKGRVFLFDNQLTVELGASKYFISEKAAFPFKSDVKYVAQVFYNFKGYNAKLNWFNEGSQAGAFRSPSGDFFITELDGFSNIDVHLSKKFEFNFFKFNVTISARNLIKDDRELNGIAIRDRRVYLGFGLEY